MKELPTIEELILQRLAFAVNSHIPNNFPQGLKFNTYIEHHLDAMVAQMRWFYFGKHLETIKYPETWWDAFKARWYPKFLKKRYPPKYVEAKRYNVCPHISEEWSNDRGRIMHIRFLDGDGEHGRDIEDDYHEQLKKEYARRIFEEG